MSNNPLTGGAVNLSLDLTGGNSLRNTIIIANIEKKLSWYLKNEIGQATCCVIMESFFCWSVPIINNF